MPFADKITIMLPHIGNQEYFVLLRSVSKADLWKYLLFLTYREADYFDLVVPEFKKSLYEDAIAMYIVIYEWKLNELFVYIIFCLTNYKTGKV
jgi:hypothetical protein